MTIYSTFRLYRLLAKYGKPDKNSGNSNTPPSKENMKDEAIRRTKTPTSLRIPRYHLIIMQVKEASEKSR